MGIQSLCRQRGPKQAFPLRGRWPGEAGSDEVEAWERSTGVAKKQKRKPPSDEGGGPKGRRERKCFDIPQVSGKLRLSLPQSASLPAPSSEGAKGGNASLPLTRIMSAQLSKAVLLFYCPTPRRSTQLLPNFSKAFRDFGKLHLLRRINRTRFLCSFVIPALVY